MRNASDRKDTHMTGKNKSGTVKSFLSSWKNDYAFKTAAGSFVSMAATVLFALYNGYLCIAFLSVWHGSICVFYLLLVAIRGIILCSERKSIKSEAEKQEAQRRRTYLISCVMLLMLDLALIVPISMMVMMMKPVYVDLVAAIAMAVYTTYKITVASVNVRKKTRNQSGDILIAELRTINFIDALVSVLTLQNTLIMVKSSPGEARDMLTLSAVTSGAVYVAIVLISVIMLIQGLKKGKTGGF